MPSTAYADLASIIVALEPHELASFARLCTKDERVLIEQVIADLTDTLPSAPGPLASYHDRPAAFARDFVKWPKGMSLAPYQAQAMTELVEHGRESVRGPHGLGKTCFASITVLWFALTRDDAGEDWKIPTTASAWLQLTHYLWPEIHKWSGKLDWEKLGRPPFKRGVELLERSLKLKHGEAFSASPADAALIEGAHARQLLYVFDEAKTIPPDVWDATEGAFSGAGTDTTEQNEAYALAISTPGEPNGRFYEVQTRKPGTEDWNVLHVSMEDAIAAGRMSREWAEARARQWGRKSAVFIRRVEGNFASSDEDGVIPLVWIEAAMQRWRDRFGYDGQDWFVPGPPKVLGVDCSSSGSDRTVMARLYDDDIIGPLERPRKSRDVEAGDEEMATAGRIVAALRTHPAARAIVDVVGIGSGVVGRAREQVDRERVIAFSAGSGTKLRDRNNELGFVNCRSAAWWNLREMLDPEFDPTLMLPPDDELIGDLTAPHWKEVSGGKISVEKKDDIRKRLGRSTDSGDAVVQAVWREGFVDVVVDSYARPRARSRR